MKRAILAALIVLSIIAGMLYAKSERIMLGAEACLYGYPLVMMDVTRANAALAIGPENQLHRVRRFPDAGFHDVVRPNVDTLYTTAFIDMAKGPWVFEMAANDRRYEVMPFMDGWTNVFAAPGTRSTGTAGGRFLLVGPLWQGPAPEGLTLLRSPTQIVWLIGRTQTNGVADYPLVRRLQDGLALRTLASWQAGRPGPAPAWQPVAAQPVAPIVQMRAMAAEDFFTRLATLLVNNPPAPADGPMLVKLAHLGLAPGKAPAWSAPDRWSASLGRWIADLTVARELQQPRDLVRGWLSPPALLGNYGTFYNTRAVVAMIGLGANLPVRAGEPFLLNARLYWPKPPALNGAWGMPAVERID